MPRANTEGMAKQRPEVAFLGGEAWIQEDTCALPGTERSSEWLEQDLPMRCKKREALSQFCCVLPSQDRQCLCVCAPGGKHCVNSGRAKHDVRNIAKHPSCKSTEDFTHINKHAFQKMMCHKVQFIYIPEPRKSPDKVSLLCFRSDTR